MNVTQLLRDERADLLPLITEIDTVAASPPPAEPRPSQAEANAMFDEMVAVAHPHGGGAR